MKLPTLGNRHWIGVAAVALTVADSTRRFRCQRNTCVVGASVPPHTASEANAVGAGEGPAVVELASAGSSLAAFDDDGDGGDGELPVVAVDRSYQPSCPT